WMRDCCCLAGLFCSAFLVLFFLLRRPRCSTLFPYTTLFRSRLAVSLMAWFFGLVVIVNLAFHFSPALASAPVLGVPLEWLFPAVMVIPLLMLLGWFYVRRATAHENQLARQLAEQPGEGSRPEQRHAL